MDKNKCAVQRCQEVRVKSGAYIALVSCEDS